MSENVALPIQRFAPLSTHLSPSRVAVVRRPCAESEPDSGSVRPNAPSTSPLANFGSHSARCSVEPPTPIAPIDEAVLHADEGARREASTRASSSATKPRNTAEFSNGRVSSHGVPRGAEVGEGLHDLHRELGARPSGR